jgi:excisionase family DNA binding protein
MHHTFARRAMTKTVDPLLWDVDRTAVELAISKAHLYRLIREKRVPFVRVGRLVRFHPKDVRAWLAERTVPSAAK